MTNVITDSVTGRQSTDVIEITPEMLSAGIQAACLFNPLDDEFDVMLPAIFRAMLAVYLRGASDH